MPAYGINQSNPDDELIQVLNALILRWEKEIVEFKEAKSQYKANKKDITKLLMDKLPDVLDQKQKNNKIRNLLYALRKQNLIKPDSENQRKSNWILEETV